MTITATTQTTAAGGRAGRRDDVTRDGEARLRAGLGRIRIRHAGATPSPTAADAADRPVSEHVAAGPLVAGLRAEVAERALHRSRLEPEARSG